MNKIGKCYRVTVERLVRFLCRKSMAVFPEYEILTAQSYYELMRKVKDKIYQGWTVQGGVSMSVGKTKPLGSNHFQDCIHYAQAILRT